MNKRFRKSISDSSARAKRTLSEIMYADNLRLLPLVSILVICISFYWIIVDKVSDSYTLDGFARICVYLHIASSVYMFFLPRLRKNRPADAPLIRLSFVAYFCLIILGVAVLTYSRNKDIVASGEISPYIGVSMAAFYLFIIAFFPLCSKKDTTIVLVAMYVGLCLPELLKRTSTYSLMSHILLCLCFTAVCYYYRKSRIEGSSHQIEVDKLSEKLQDEAICDQLTGILNRRAMDEYIDHLLKNSHAVSLGVIFFDIDFFKKYNDHYGHVEGDEVLRKIAEISTKAMEYLSNAYVFRYGGEEFTVLIEGADESTLIKAMKKLRRAIYDAGIVREDTNAFDRITITVGGALEPLPNKSGDYVIAADNQLYIGKNTGRNSVYYKSQNCESSEESSWGEINAGVEDKPRKSLQTDSEELKEIERSANPFELPDSRAEMSDESKRYEKTFEKALAGGEFVMFCQPYYNAKTREIKGAEALVHLKTPIGYILPGEFVPLLERNGLVARLDEYMLRSVCEVQKQCKEKKLPLLPITVNLSRVTLTKPGIIEHFAEILKESGISSQLVPIEITESFAMDPVLLREKSGQLKAAGFKLQMDDFGSGYSSLSNLGNLSFDTIKIGKELVDRIGDPTGEEILRHTMELIHFLKKEIVAEGVESGNQLAFLEKIGCDLVQGFYLSRPVEAKDYLQMLMKSRKSPQTVKGKDTADTITSSISITGDVKLQYLSALAGIYMTMHVINLTENSVVEFATTTNVKGHVNKAHDANAQMTAAMRATVSDEYIDRVLEFVDLSTIVERMGSKRSIQMDFVGKHFGWTRAQFVVVSTNTRDEAEIIIFTTQVVEANKHSQEKVEACITDELTGVGNQLAYDRDLPSFPSTLRLWKRSQFTVLCANIDRLKDTRIQQGNVAADELLYGTADCLNRVFGKIGRVYHLKDDSFMVLFCASTEETSLLRTQLEELADSWIGNTARNLSLSCGIAALSEFPDLKPEELAAEAIRRV